MSKKSLKNLYTPVEEDHEYEKYDRKKAANLIRLSVLYGKGVSQNIKKIRGRKLKSLAFDGSDYEYDNDDIIIAKKLISECQLLKDLGIHGLELANSSSKVNVRELMSIMELELRLSFTQRQMSALVFELGCMEGEKTTLTINYNKFLTSIKALIEALREDDRIRRRKETQDMEDARLERQRALSPDCDERAGPIQMNHLTQALKKLTEAASIVWKQGERSFLRFLSLPFSMNENKGKEGKRELDGSMNATHLKDFLKQNLNLRLSLEESKALIILTDRVGGGRVPVDYFVHQLKQLALGKHSIFKPNALNHNIISPTNTSIINNNSINLDQNNYDKNMLRSKSAKSSSSLLASTPINEFKASKSTSNLNNDSPQSMKHSFNYDPLGPIPKSLLPGSIKNALPVFEPVLPIPSKSVLPSIKPLQDQISPLKKEELNDTGVRKRRVAFLLQNDSQNDNNINNVNNNSTKKISFGTTSNESIEGDGLNVQQRRKLEIENRINRQKRRERMKQMKKEQQYNEGSALRDFKEPLREIIGVSKSPIPKFEKHDDIYKKVNFVDTEVINKVEVKEVECIDYNNDNNNSNHIKNESQFKLDAIQAYKNKVFGKINKINDVSSNENSPVKNVRFDPYSVPSPTQSSLTQEYSPPGGGISSPKNVLNFLSSPVTSPRNNKEIETKRNDINDKKISKLPLMPISLGHHIKRGGASSILRAKTPVGIRRSLAPTDNFDEDVSGLKTMETDLRRYLHEGLTRLPLSGKQEIMRYERRWPLMANLIQGLNNCHLKPEKLLSKLMDNINPDKKTIVKDPMNDIGIWIDRKNFNYTVSSLGLLNGKESDNLFTSLDPRRRGAIPNYELVPLLNTLIEFPCSVSNPGKDTRIEDVPKVHIISLLTSTFLHVEKVLTNFIPASVVESVLCNLCNSHIKEREMLHLLLPILNNLSDTSKNSKLSIQRLNSNSSSNLDHKKKSKNNKDNLTDYQKQLASLAQDVNNNDKDDPITYVKCVNKINLIDMILSNKELKELIENEFQNISFKRISK